MSKKVLITSRSFGAITDEPFRILREAGIEWEQRGAVFSQAWFEDIIPEFDALIIGAHAFPADVMARCHKLQLVCKHGVGLDNIPLEKAKELGVVVCNAPGVNADAVADLTFGLMLGAARKIVLADRQVRQGKWNNVIGVDVCHKTLGLLGFGAVAKNVARRARGFGMAVLAYDPYVTELPEEFSGYVTLCDLDTVIGGADFLSLHLPRTEETLGMIGEKELGRMKQGAFLINTSRGGIVREDALYEMLRCGHLAGAATDVSEKEPMAEDNPLRTLDNVIITPHIGMNSREATNAISVLCAENVAACLAGGEVKFRVV